MADIHVASRFDTDWAYMCDKCTARDEEDPETNERGVCLACCNGPVTYFG